MTDPLPTLADVRAPLLALRVLVSEFPGLPAGTVRVSDVYPDRLDVSLHDGLDTFEAWREALGIAPGLVTCGTQNAGATWVLKAFSDYAGARVCLTGFADVAAPTGGAA
jgi:hypothetical protein